VWAWGSNEFGQIGQPLSFVDSHVPLKVAGSKNIISVEGGMYFSLALDSDGAVWAWGRNDYGQLGRDDITQSSKPLKVPGLENIKAIAAGAHHAVAMDSEGALWQWGWNYAESLKFAPPHKVGGLTGITNAAAGVHFTTVLKGK
ncbi:MAG TPA: RCC1 repeat-containing protein, partial [Nitrospirae bacterium]|nr:RCC1 repeat-containing protein [Nitrospirota bacterium]